MQGDLCYIKIKILEGPEYIITAHMNGFFINECVENKTFDPRPASRVNPCYSHTIVGLLYQASPRFRIGFEQHLNNLLTADPLTL